MKPRHAGQQARRGCLRLLRGLATRSRRCNHRGDHALRKAGEFRLARSRAGWATHPRHRDSQTLLVRHHLRPLPKEVEVWDISDRSHVLVHTIASLPLADRVPIHGVPVGPRDFSWRATEPATLVWAEALDGGDWNVKVPARDKILLLKAPFNSPAVEIARIEQRYDGFSWSERPTIALLNEFDQNRHWRRSFLIDVDDPQRKPRLLWDLSTDEKYANPGNPVRRQLANGSWVVRQDGDSIYLAGTGSSPEGDRPFLDRLDLKTLKSERLFRSDKTSYEQFLSFTGPDARTFLTWHQSPADPPNAFVRTLGKSVAAPAGEAAFASTSVRSPTFPIRRRRYERSRSA